MNFHEAIYEALDDEWRSAADIAEMVHTSPSNARQKLLDLWTAGRARRRRVSNAVFYARRTAE